MRIAAALFLFLICSTTAHAQNVPAELVGYKFQVSEAVPTSEVKLIQAAMADAHGYFERHGVRLTDKQRQRFVTKIVNTGRGNQERGGGGSCCTSQSETNKSGPRLFFDVGHKDWKRDSARKRNTVAHEYTHGIQSSLGVKSWSRSLMADWMEEGMAEFYAREIAAGKSKSKRRASEKQVFSWVRKDKVFNYKLRQLEPNGGHPHPGNLGYLAVVGLVEISEKKTAAPLIYMQLLKKHGRKRAFQEAFGISLDEFYNRFEDWQTLARRGKTSQPIWSRL